MTDEVSQYNSKRYRDAKLSTVLQGKHHQHSHFTDVNGKDAVFENFDFSYCIFTRAYFHNTTFTECRFVGAHFIDCNFRNANLRDCDFSYTSFNGTRIPTNEILNNLPSWPNARRELTQILRRNAASVGDYESEKMFVIKEINAEKEHYRRAWRQDELYYRKKYNSRFKRLLVGLKLLALKFDNFVWGHGERLWNTLIPLCGLLIVFSVVLTVNNVQSIDKVTVSDVWNLFVISIVYYLNLFFSLPDDSRITGILLIDWLVVSTRFITIGVIVAALYRRLSHR